MPQQLISKNEITPSYTANISSTLATQAEMESGTETELRSMTPENIKHAITYQADPKGRAVAMSIIFGG